MVYRVWMWVLLFLVFPQVIFAGDLSNFILRDGNKFQAEILSFANGSYRLRSDALGDFNLLANEIVFIDKKTCCFTEIKMSFPVAATYSAPPIYSAPSRHSSPSIIIPRPTKQEKIDPKQKPKIAKAKAPIAVALPATSSDIVPNLATSSNIVPKQAIDTEPERQTDKEEEATIVVTPDDIVPKQEKIDPKPTKQAKIDPMPRPQIVKAKATIIVTPVAPPGDINSNSTRIVKREAFSVLAGGGSFPFKGTKIEDAWPVLPPNSISKLVALR